MTREEQFLQLVQTALLAHFARKPLQRDGEIPRDLSEMDGMYDDDSMFSMSLAQQVVITGKLPARSPCFLAMEFVHHFINNNPSKEKAKNMPEWIRGVGWASNDPIEEEATEKRFGFNQT